MKKSNISLFALAGMLLAACSSPTVPIPSPTTATNAASAADSFTQTNAEALVTVAVTPLNLNDQSATTLDFDIALNTHSVDLGYDLTQIATLSNDAGEQVQPANWNGPTGSGHHREGTLSFPQLKQRGQTLTLTLRGIADVPERIFTWKVNE
ncbi:hypothetical protein TFLX_06637 [Thermoflexales bacterium]|nr:hypothetical protein TFLX_06637 [Thermoflexales bacterium]